MGDINSVLGERRGLNIAVDGIDCMGKDTLIRSIVYKASKTPEFKDYSVNYFSISGNNSDIPAVRTIRKAIFDIKTYSQPVVQCLFDAIAHYMAPLSTHPKDAALNIWNRYTGSKFAYRGEDEAVADIYDEFDNPDIHIILTTGCVDSDVALMRKRLQERGGEDVIERNGDDFHRKVASRMIQFGSDTYSEMRGDQTTVLFVDPNLSTEAQVRQVIDEMFNIAVSPIRISNISIDVYNGPIGRIVQT